MRCARNQRGKRFGLAIAAMIVAALLAMPVLVGAQETGGPAAEPETGEHVATEHSDTAGAARGGTAHAAEAPAEPAAEQPGDTPGHEDPAATDHGEADHGEADHGEADHGEADHGEADHGHPGHGAADHGDGGHGGHGPAANPADAEASMKKALDTDVKIKSRHTAEGAVDGEVVISYSSEDNLKAIAKQILGLSPPETRKEMAEKMEMAMKAKVSIDDSSITIGFASLEALAKIEERVTSWKPPLWSVTGFVLMLLCIAVIPLVNGHWWEHNKNRGMVSAILGVPLGIYVIMNDWHALIHSFHEYEQFIILLGSLYVISGGIWLSGDVRATPKNNAIFIGIGALLASFIGTTGAAMLLIRPLLQTNKERKYVVHTVVFFIFLVANIGGSLTPVGDPPLFLGYLKGVPFTWTLVKLWPFWLMTVIFLLALYFAVDSWIYNKKESDESKAWDDTEIQPIKLKGSHNFLFLLGVVLSVALYPMMLGFMTDTLAIDPHTAEYLPVREAIMVIMAILSWVTTNMEYRKVQNYSWDPILEVAILFAAIFVTMIPALVILRAWGPTSPIREPWHFFWITGALSSFLDNAPTYLVFLSLGEGQGVAQGMAGVGLNSGGAVKEITLVAISLGAVFMGANSYIGNAPNFMVKSISEENKIKMPSFFGYMAWSIGILVPTFIIITFLIGLIAGG